MQEERQVKYPCIYTHFKHNPEGDFNNYIYCTMGVSIPKPIAWFPRDIYKHKVIETTSTETEGIIPVYVIDNQMYHVDEIKKEQLVIYKSLYDSKKPWSRPVGEFLSKVPEGRESENPTGQIYRFEEVDR